MRSSSSVGVRPLTPSRPVLIAAGAIVAAVWAVAVLFRVLRPSPSRIDTGWNALMGASTGPAAHAVAGWLAVAGTGVPAVLTVLGAGALVALLRDPPHGVLVLAVAGLSQLDVTALKLTAARPRPSPLFSVDTSFPSGHTTNASVVASVLVLLLGGRVLPVLGVVWVALMAWGRTVLHAHWLSDVLTGAVLGAASAVLLVHLGEALIARRRGPATTTPEPIARPDLRGSDSGDGGGSG